MTFHEIIFRKIERFERGYKYCYTYHSENPALVGTWFDSHGKKTVPPDGFIEGIIEGVEVPLSGVIEDPYFEFIESLGSGGCYPGGSSEAMLELKNRSCQQ